MLIYICVFVNSSIFNVQQSVVCLSTMVNAVGSAPSTCLSQVSRLQATKTQLRLTDKVPFLGHFKLLELLTGPDPVLALTHLTQFVEGFSVCEK